MCAVVRFTGKVLKLKMSLLALKENAGRSTFEPGLTLSPTETGPTLWSVAVLVTLWPPITSFQQSNTSVNTTKRTTGCHTVGLVMLIKWDSPHRLTPWGFEAALVLVWTQSKKQEVSANLQNQRLLLCLSLGYFLKVPFFASLLFILDSSEAAIYK